MRLFKAEIKKLWKNTVFLIIIAVLLCANAFLLWRQASQDAATGAIPAQSYAALGAKLRIMNEEGKGTELQTLLQQATAMKDVHEYYGYMEWQDSYMAEQIAAKYGEAFDEYQRQYRSGGYLVYTGSIYQELAFLSAIQGEYDAVTAYEAFLAGVQSTSQSLSAISIMGGDAGSYSSRENALIAAAYQKISNVNISYYPQMGLVTALGFGLTDILILIAIIAIASSLIQYEKDSGLINLIRSTNQGRLGTALTKCGALALSMLALVCLFYGTNLLLCNTLYGLGPLGRSIQSVPLLQKSTLQISVGGYLLLFTGAKAIVTTVVGVGVMLALLWAKRFLTGALLAVAFPVASWLVRAQIPATSPHNLYKYANIASLLQTNEVLGSFRVVNLFDSPVPMLTVEAITVVLLLAALLTGFLLCFQCMQTTKKRGGAAWLNRLRTRLRPQKGRSLFFWECRKLLVSGGAAILLAVFAALQIHTCVNQVVFKDINEAMYGHYMRKLQGPLTGEKLAWLGEKGERVERYLNGKLTEGDYNSGFGYEIEYEVYSKILYEKLPYMYANPPAVLVYDTGYRYLFGLAGSGAAGDALLPTALCILCSFLLYTGEYRTGMVKVLRATPNGKTRLVQKRLLLAICMAAVIALLSSLPRLVYTIKGFGLGGFFAPAPSLPWFSHIPGGFSIASLYAGALLARTAACLLVILATYVLSIKTQNQLATLVTSALLWLVPPLLATNGLPFLQWFSVLPLYTFGGLLAGSATTFVALFFPVAALAGTWVLHNTVHFSFGNESSQ